MNTVFVAGSLNIDQRIRVRSLPKAGETVIGGDAIFMPGGKGGNQVVAASRSGGTVRFIGAVGNDVHGGQIVQVLEGEGIDCSCVRVIEDMPTGVAIIPVDEAGENSIIVCPGANFELRGVDMMAGLASVTSGDVVVLQLEIPLEIVRQAARLARSKGALVMLNAAPAPASIDGLFDDVDILIVNEHEIQVIADLLDVGSATCPATVQILSAELQAEVVCTVGSGGSYAVIDGALVNVPAPTVEVVDTTGSGDTFIGYLATSLSRRPEDLLLAMEVATRAAAHAVTRRGAMESIPVMQEAWLSS